jgi:dihydrofolate synthase/folylpolyglutamate synthase
LFGIKLGLDNIANFLDKIDNPQNRFASIHIAGTNGKGSTAAFIESILRRAGYKTGIFTSPHLADYRERIRVDGQPISKKYITDFVKKYRHSLARDKITFFETCTALAFCYLASRRVDVGIIEVGLGGRLDATNTLRPILSVITDISYDHTNILGKTLTRIAYEKAGIVKPQTAVLTGLMPSEARREIDRVCSRRSAPLYSLRRSDFARNGRRFRFDYARPDLNLAGLESSLPGVHQIKNAALAVRAVELLNEIGYSIGPRAIRSGLKKTDWPGRFQIIKQRGKPVLILDVGHNPAGVKSIVDCFRELYPGRRADIVLGFVRNKNMADSVKHLKAIARRVEILRLNTHRSADPDEIKRYFGNNMDVNISASVVNSVRQLIDRATPDDIIIICGSHYAVGELMAKRHLIL